MKKFLFLLILFISCKKEPDKEITMAIKVSDSITGTPVVGATLSLYTCGVLGCTYGYKEIFKGTTDNNGVVNAPLQAYQDLSTNLSVAKSDYLGFQLLQQRKASLLLRPKGWLW